MSGDTMNLNAGSAREMEERALEAKIVRELERVLEISTIVPEDFAVHVAAKVPARRIGTGTPTHYGRAIMRGSLVVLLIAMLVLAGWGFGGSKIGRMVEWTLCVQFLAIAVWMGSRWRSS